MSARQIFRVQADPEFQLRRNRMIILMIVEIFAIIVGFAFYALRRNSIMISVNGIATVLTIIGFFGAVKANFVLTLMHAISTTGIVGSFFVYELLFAFFGPHPKKDEYQIDENVLLLITLIPYIFDLCAGIYGCFYFVLHQDLCQNEDSEAEGEDSHDGYEELKEVNNIEDYLRNSTETDK